MVDYIVEPVRSKLIPGYEDIKSAAISAGAIGCCISGSGPSVYALCENKNTADKVSSKMCQSLDKESMKYHSYISSVNHEGIKEVTK